MKKYHFCLKALSLTFTVAMFFFMANAASAAITATTPYESEVLSDPDPAVMPWTSSITYYDGYLIYAGSDSNIYAMNLDTGESSLVCDLSDNTNFGFGPSAFLVTQNNCLLFADNGMTSNLYRVMLADTWPADYVSFDTECIGTIFTITENPWTDAAWFATADLSTGIMYLYEVNMDEAATEKAAFTAPNAGGNGPIIFESEDNLLYGESPWGGDGYFHLLDSSTGEITETNYITFTDGLASAAYGYDDKIIVTTGNGKAVYEIEGNTASEVAATDNAAQGITFDGTSFYISEMESELFTGVIGFSSLWNPEAAAGSSSDDDDSSSTCFINTGFHNTDALTHTLIFIAFAGIGILSIRFFRTNK